MSEPRVLGPRQPLNLQRVKERVSDMNLIERLGLKTAEDKAAERARAARKARLAEQARQEQAAVRRLPASAKLRAERVAAERPSHQQDPL